MKTKKFLLITWLLILVLLAVSACTPRSVKKRMVKYYSDDSNYVSFVGTIIDILELDGGWQIRIYSCEADGFYSDNMPDYENEYIPCLLTKQCYDKIKDENFSLEIGKQYIFTSATYYWYSGFDYPIVAIQEVDTDIVYFDLEFGKESYIHWIKYVLK